jgi:formamidopyrimidine-DNA glycosylase
MPEILEVEMFRQAALRVVGRTVREVSAPDRLVVCDVHDVRLLEGRRIVDVTRHGKLMTIHAGTARDRVSIDVHFGMSGRIVVDGWSPIGELAYGASDDAKWTRFALRFGRGELLLSDPRRFARVRPSEFAQGLGPDAFEVSVTEFSDRLRARRAPIKAVLLDQAVVAGLGNMLVDEILLRAAFDPRRSAASFGLTDLAKIHRVMRKVLPELARKGGSHAGRLSAELRVPGAECPIDGHPLDRCVVGGRTTFFCPFHQR